MHTRFDHILSAEQNTIARITIGWMVIEIHVVAVDKAWNQKIAIEK